MPLFPIFPFRLIPPTVIITTTLYLMKYRSFSELRLLSEKEKSCGRSMINKWWSNDSIENNVGSGVWSAQYFSWFFESFSPEVLAFLPANSLFGSIRSLGLMIIKPMTKLHYGHSLEPDER